MSIFSVASPFKIHVFFLRNGFHVNTKAFRTILEGLGHVGEIFRSMNFENLGTVKNDSGSPFKSNPISIRGENRKNTVIGQAVRHNQQR